MDNAKNLAKASGEKGLIFSTLAHSQKGKYFLSIPALGHSQIRYKNCELNLFFAVTSGLFLFSSLSFFLLPHSSLPPGSAAAATTGDRSERGVRGEPEAALGPDNWAAAAAAGAAGPAGEEPPSTPVSLAASETRVAVSSVVAVVVVEAAGGGSAGSRACCSSRSFWSGSSRFGSGSLQKAKEENSCCAPGSTASGGNTWSTIEL